MEQPHAVDIPSSIRHCHHGARSRPRAPHSAHTLSRHRHALPPPAPCARPLLLHCKSAVTLTPSLLHAPLPNPIHLRSAQMLPSRSRPPLQGIPWLTCDGWHATLDAAHRATRIASSCSLRVPLLPPPSALGPAPLALIAQLLRPSCAQGTRAKARTGSLFISSHKQSLHQRVIFCGVEGHLLLLRGGLLHTHARCATVSHALAATCDPGGRPL